ncbi:MAG: SusC/RagA family TonB-linked outer membrane protein [Flavobacterium sp. BFFFF1]|uniref:SusC/RagA family TonB-linked outer membrane protein n=1 Tax=Flavobacterium sp. BFFFF1 TaxID=2015557 RepID=UPI000BCFB0C6|nr:TonB-dependent receptor [Flavobacterium sp. BFFFF1]OYU79550.1 MAG: SusC/RagA family TonB-linked outer membrane protein [Flavobacterium sp. BFFFF1]
MKFTKLRFLCFLSILFSGVIQAQDVSVKGKVNDENGLPMPGVSVTDQKSSMAVATDIDGNYEIKTNGKNTLSFSFIGYKTTTEVVNGRTTINVQMQTEAQSLNEVVVVGYGTQKKSLVTGAISSVKAKDIENLPITRIEQSLQGRVAGVTIAMNAGQPGSGSTVRIRGITTLNGGNDPLYVVDGVVLESSAIGYLNQSDIESIEVLKDAASAAIYGTRGASGVILITTKKGKSGKITVTYNGYAGTSEPARKLDLLNATQYATLINEAQVNGGGAIRYADPASLGKGTDWQSQIFNDQAQRSSHEVSVSGGNEMSNFYLSFGLRDEEGIVSTDISNYNRKNFRLNSTHKFAKWFTVGENIGFSREKVTGLGNTNSEFGGPLASAINLDPVTPVIVTNPADLAQNPYTRPDVVKDANGNPYGISQYVGNEITNPLAYAQTRQGNYSWADNIVGNAFLEIEPIKGLKFKTNYTFKKAYYGDYSFTPVFYLSAVQLTTRNSLFKSTNTTEDWQIENTITYTKQIKGHNFTLLAGQGAYEYGKGGGQGVTYYNQPTNDWREASFNWATLPADIDGYGYTNTTHTLSSLFGRLNYDYNEKYLLTATIRRDGSSRFGANNKYGNFPSFSAGWVPSKESFWKDNDIVSSLKLRGSWGVTGTDVLPDFRYLPLISGGYNYYLGTGGNATVGNGPNTLANPDLQWEQTTQTDIGMDITLFKNLNLTVEYYNKKTDKILREIIIPGYVGVSTNPSGNVGAMKNSGLEFEMSYRKKIGDLNINLSGNFATLKNEVTAISPAVDFYNGPSIQSSAYPITRTEVGHSYMSFYGFQTNGVFQNQAEIDAYTNSTGTVIQPNAVPGDFKWKDINDDGKIDSDDRDFIGNGLPDFSYGVTLALDYKGFDLRVFGQGVGGNQIYQGLRRLDLGVAPNFQTAALGRWTGEGSTNSYPRLTSNDTNLNFSNPSNFYLQDGDYFRIKQIQLGYSLPSEIIGKAGLQKVRLYVTGENLFTFTKYTGYDPEIGGDVIGIDRGYYPQAKSYMFGVNLQF